MRSALIILHSMILAVFIIGTANAAAPDLPSGAGQWKTNGITSISPAGSTDETTVRIIATVTDPDTDNVLLEVEIINNASSFTGTPNCSSEFVTSGSSATASCTGLYVGVAYKWQARTNDGTAVSAWQPNGGSPDFSVTSNRLIHNSNVTGNASYGAWGVAGGKYGEFTCSTCHTKAGSTTNIKMIRETIDAPNASDTWPNGSTTTGSIVFTSADGIYSDMGDASATGGFTGVCNVCHDNANHTHYSYNSSDGTHNVGMDCTECHLHVLAFSVNCDNCHGEPPVDSNTLAQIPGTTGSVTAGAHNTHVNGKSYSCDTCHYDNLAALEHNNGGSRDVSIGFYITSSTQGGHYDGQAAVTYDALTTSAPTTVSKTGTRQCSNLYCHSDSQSTDGNSPTASSYKTPSWSGIGTVLCGDCHNTAAPNPSILTGSHNAHMLRVGFGVEGCNDCHAGAASDASSYNSTNHVNGLMDISAGYGYNAGGEPGNGYGECTSAICHDNGTGVALTTPTWGDTVAACTQCHAAAPATGSHDQHLAAYSGGSIIGCDKCHSDAVKSTTPPTGIHLDGDVDVYDASETDLGYPANVAKHTAGSGYSNCTTASCHVSAYSTAYIPSPTWGAGTGCGDCHAIDTDGAPATGSHNKHLSLDTNVALCADCHAGTVKDTSAGTAHVDGDIDVLNGYPANVVKHASGTGYSNCTSTYCHSNVQAPGGSGAATIYASPTWGNTGSMTCGSCHTDMATTEDLSLGTHKRHTNSPPYAQYDCSLCHGFGYTSSTVSYPSHVNGNIDNTFTGSATGTNYAPAGSNPPGNGYGTCSNTNCHGQGSKYWGTYTKSPVCEKCHGSARTASGPTCDDITYTNSGDCVANGGVWSIAGFKDTNGVAGSVFAGSHVSHLSATRNYSDPIACDECHQVPALPSDPGHNDTAAPAELTWGSLATHVRWTASVSGTAMVPSYTGAGGEGPRRCNNTYCHEGVRNTNDNRDDLGTQGTAPKWGDPAYLGGTGCDKCHDYAPGYPHPTYSNNCNACHPHVNFNNISFLNKSLHINGEINWDVDACLDCHSYENATPLLAGHAKHTDPDLMLSTFVSAGTANGGDTDTLIDTDVTFTSATVGQYLRITSGVNIYRQLKIDSFTATSVTVVPAFASAVSSGDEYEIRKAKLLSAGDYSDPSWIYDITYKYGFPKYACGTCHPMDDPLVRNDGVVQLDLDPSHAAAGTVKTKNASDTSGFPGGDWYVKTTGVSVRCMGIYCHSNGYISEGSSTYAFNQSPEWYDVITTSTGVVTSAPWDGMDQCAQCHGNSPNTGGRAGSTAHAKHVVGVHYKDLYSGLDGKMAMSGTAGSGAVHGDSGTSTPINCNLCHNNTVGVRYNAGNTVCSACHSDADTPATGDEMMYVKTDNTSHVNGVVNMSFASGSWKSRAQVRDDITNVAELSSSWTRNNGYKATSSYDNTKLTPAYTAGACLSISCHNNTTMEWEKQGPLSCNACHKGLAQ